MILRTYIENELVESLRGMTEDKLSNITKILLQNPLILNLSEIGCIPKIDSSWNGTIFSDIDIEDYAAYVEGTNKVYFAIVLNNKVSAVINLHDEKYIAIMSSNPIFKLEDDTL